MHYWQMNYFIPSSKRATRSVTMLPLPSIGLVVSPYLVKILINTNHSHSNSAGGHLSYRLSLWRSISSHEKHFRFIVWTINVSDAFSSRGKLPWTIEPYRGCVAPVCCQGNSALVQQNMVIPFKVTSSSPAYGALLLPPTHHELSEFYVVI